MTIKSLENTSKDLVIECFNKAFEGYFVKMPTDPDYYKRRWRLTGVRWDRSYGMFIKDKLAGFILSAIDEREGDSLVYNTGTGVIPEFRGQRIIKSIYQYALPVFKSDGLSKCVLEVIKENHFAIRSYESIGFNISKSYKCFDGEISQLGPAQFTINELAYNDVDWVNMGPQHLYSWDNHWHSLRYAGYRYFQVLDGTLPESFFAIDIDSGYVPQLEVLNMSPIAWERLFQAIRTLSTTIKINNVDEELTTKIKALESAGLENTVNQYEMQLDLLAVD